LVQNSKIYPSTDLLGGLFFAETKESARGDAAIPTALGNAETSQNSGNNAIQQLARAEAMAVKAMRASERITQ